VGASTSHNPMGNHDLLQGYVALPYYHNISIYYTKISLHKPLIRPSLRSGASFFSFLEWGETESTWYFGHYWPIVPAPDDR
jgi:hypothetical protein